jgi:hypothetical protein
MPRAPDSDRHPDAVRTLPLAWRVDRRLRQLDVDLVHTTSVKADRIGVPVARLGLTDRSVLTGLSRTAWSRSTG